MVRVLPLNEGSHSSMPPLSDDWLASAVALLRSRTPLVPRVGIILGSGLGGFAAEVEGEATLPYREIPGFPVSTAIGHKGQLTLGRFAGVPVAVLEGRFHLYEGYAVDQVVRPIHLLQALGVEVLIVTNAAGGLNPGLRMGDVVVVEDQVNLMWTGPGLGYDGRDRLTQHGFDFPLSDTSLPPSFSSAPLSASGNTARGLEQKETKVTKGGKHVCLYDPELAAWALEAARAAEANSSRGVYIGMTGPNYETRAEYRWLRQVGDLVGMSTVPEVLTAHSLEMRVLGLSVVSNECNPDALEPTDGAQVVAAVSRAEGRLRSIVRGVLGRWQLCRPQTPD